MEERIRAAQAHYEKMIKQLQSERDAKVAELKSGVSMMRKLMEFEQQEMGGVRPAATPTAATPPASPQVLLADFFRAQAH